MGSSIQGLRLRLLVGGVEIPINSCGTQGGESMAGVAAVSVPPHDAVSDLLPGSSVMVFYYDGRYKTHSVRGGRYVLESLKPKDPRRWKLLHNGILRGYDRSKSVGGDWTVTLHSAAPSFLYNRIQQYYGGYKNGGSASVDMSFIGASAGDTAGRRFNKKLAGASAPSEIYNVIKQGADLYGGNWIAGIRLLLKKISFNNNEYWEGEYKRLRVGDMIVGFDQDQTSNKLFPQAKFSKYIKDALGGMSAQTAIRDVVNFLLGTLYHTWWETPAPHLSLGSVGLDSQSKTLVSGSDPVYEGWSNANLCASYMLPDIWWATPPACNVLFPDDYTDLQTGRDFYSEATRMLIRTEVDLRGKQWAVDSHYAPSIDSMREFFNNPDLPEAFNARNATTLLPWEKYTGPISNIHRVDQIPSKTKSEALTAFLSHVANYDYWSLRTERRASAVGPFNPDIAVGLPCAIVLDANHKLTESQWPGGAGYVASGKGRRGLYPQVLIGRVTSVSHSVAQASASTVIQLENVRYHDEDFDLDGGRGDDVEQLLNAHEDATQEDLRFFGESYDANKIGEAIYKPLLGIGSVVDVSGESWTKQALDRLVAGYAERRVNPSASVRETNQTITARPVADYVQIVGDAAIEWPDDYKEAGFLYPVLEVTGTKRTLKKVKADRQTDVDKSQVADTSSVEDDGLWDGILETSTERRDAALAVQKILRERVFRG